MKSIKRILSMALVLMMIVGLFPNAMITPARADLPSSMEHALTYNGKGGFTFNAYGGGRGVSVSNRIDGTSGTLGGLNNHSLDGRAAFCINPTAGAEAGLIYSLNGTAAVANTSYWQRMSNNDKRFITALVQYYTSNPEATWSLSGGCLQGAGSAAWVAKLGTQLAIFNYVITDSNAITDFFTNDGRDNTWEDLITYADNATSWAQSQVSNSSSVSVAAPTFNVSGNKVKLTYNGTNYVGTVTDTSGALASEGYDFNQTVSGVVVTQSGNTVTITASPSAAVALQNQNNSWSVSSTVTKTGSSTINLYSMKVYDAGSDKQNIVVPEPNPEPYTNTASNTATLYAYAEMVGKAKLIKTSADTSITSGNSCYSLEGAVYGVYSDSACRNLVARLTTDANGVSNTVDLTAGTYYVKEISAPRGYRVDGESHSITVRPNETAELNVSDKPTNDPVPIILRKKDDKTSTPGYTSGKMSLADAQYTFKYYPGYYNTPEAAEESGAPLRTWIVKTDTDGFADIRDPNYIVAGSDALYRDSDNHVSIPLGTVVVQETKAPVGYIIDSTKYLIKITEDGASSSIISASNEAIVPETPIMGGVKVAKNDAENGSAQGDAKFDGAKFAIYNNSGKSVTVNGVDYVDGAVVQTIEIRNGVAASGKTLPYGDYIIKESAAPAGYKLNTSWSKSFSITTDGQVFDAGVCSDSVIRGGLSVKKVDADSTSAQGAASLAGAEFTIYNASDAAVIVNDQSYAPNAEITVIVTRANGIASTESILPYGRYRIVETKAPAGYTRNTSWSKTVSVAEQGVIVEAENCPDSVVRGGVTVKKVDADIGSKQGNASLAGAEFTIYNANEQSVTVNGTAYAKNAAVLKITTNDAGVASSAANVLPYGKYRIEETKAPEGYNRNTSWSKEFTITSNNTIVEAGECSDPVIRGGLSIQKSDAGLGTTTPYGDASFEGITFSVINSSSQSVVVNGETIAPNKEATRIITNAQGFATTGAAELPYGKYTVKEIATVDGRGYGVNGDFSAEVTVSEQGVVVAASNCPNTGNIFGGVKIQKIDKNNNSAEPEGDASLAGAKFDIINKSANPVIMRGSSNVINVNDVVTTIETNSNGVASLDKVLPMGTYEIKEKSPSTGYVNNNSWSAMVYVRSNETYEVNGPDSCPETPIMGGVSVQKYDKSRLDETNDYAQAKVGPGGIKLSNAEITIINRSEKAIVFEGRSIPPYSGDFDPANATADGIVTRIYTNDEGLASTGNHDLPYGTYELHETSAPSGYLLNEEWTQTIEIREDGAIVALDNDKGVVDELARTDIDFHKEGVIGNTHTRLGLVAFRITNNDTGESHIIVTDPNGTFDSATYPHTQNTNANDAAVDARGNVNADMLDYEAGVWFGGDTAMDALPDGTPVGAFVYSKTGYTLEELRTPANSSDRKTGNIGWELITDCVIMIPRRNSTTPYPVGTITDTRPEGISTRLTDKASGEHQAEASDSVILVDNVVYSGLTPGDTYMIKGELRDKATGEPIMINGAKVLCQKDFVPSSTNDAEGEPVEFRFDASSIKGKTVVAYEYLYHVTDNGSERFEDLIASHEDLDSDAQTVSFPSIRTTAHNADDQHEFDIRGAGEFVDTVYYENLEPDVIYNLTATLVDKSTGNAVKDSSGHVIKAEHEFKPDSRNGSVDVVFNVNGDDLAGKCVVVYETLKFRSNTIARHEDITDEQQTLNFPEISTTLVSEDGIHTAKAEGTITLTDTVDYSGLIINHEYTVKGTLMDKSTGSAILDATGAPITATKPFTADSTDGSVEIKFTFDASVVEGSTVVAFEELYNNLGVVAEHKDINDEEQTVAFPSILTTARNQYDEVNDMFAKGTVKIYDDIHYSNLIPGETYKASGKLMDKANNAPFLDKNGNEVTGEKTFKADASGNGIVTVEFSFAVPEGMEDMDIVAFEIVSQGSVEVCKHEDIDDEDQTIHVPKIRTTATVSGNHEAKADASVTVIDTVTYSNLIPNEEYVLTGTLMRKDNNKPLRDADGDPITVSKTFTPAEKSGSEDLAFTFDASALGGKDIVAFEVLTRSDITVAEHKNINDEDQTVSFPTIRTTLQHADSEHLAPADSSITLTDTVLYSNLIVGHEYTVTGKLVDKETGDPIVDANGDEITAESTFTATERNGSEDVVFTFDASALAGKSVVAFEKLFVGTAEIADHEDKNDEDQTVSFPKIATKAADKNGNQEIFVGKKVEVIDTVSYDNLIPGKTYKLSAELMDKESGSTILDSEGNAVVAEKKFKPDAASGTVEVKFSWIPSDLEGKTVVAFETLYIGSARIADHKDLEDKEQTVTFPKIRTTATVGEIHEAEAKDGIQLVDRIHYENLEPHVTYKLSGVVVQKSKDLLGREIGKAVRNNNDEDVRAEQEFTPDEAEGYIDLKFLLDAAKLEGDKVIVFEELIREEPEEEDRVVAEHKDLNDEDQMVWFPKIRTTLLSEDELHLVYAGDSVKLTDTVSYSNLIAGHEYTLNGKLMDKASNTAIVDENGEEIVASTTFKPVESDGIANVEFTFDASAMAGKTVVAFEELSVEGKIIAVHKDINDEEQAVNIPAISTDAHGTDLEKDIMNADVIHVIDDVTYENLIPGKTYVLEGKLMDKSTGEVFKDAEGKEVSLSVEFKPEEPSGVKSLDFEIKSSDLGGRTLVAFETLFHMDVKIADHTDIEDEDQTVTIPKIWTTALVGGSHTAFPGEETKIVDTVFYENLIPGKAYKLTGSIVTKVPGVLGGVKADPILDEYKNEVIAVAEFTPEEANGSVDVTFIFDATKLAGKNVTIFEKLTRGDRLIAEHVDLDDEDQIIHFPTIRTTALGEDGNKNIIPSEDGKLYTIIDTVEYTNLIPGETYKVSGVLRDKSDGSVIKAKASESAEAEAINVEVEFVPTEANGSIDVVFVVPAESIMGKTIVAFESLMSLDNIVAQHQDINDEAQTVNITFREKLFKYDASDYKGLAGAIFEVRDITSSSKEVQKITSGEDGYAYFNGMPGHEYSIKEVKAPTGYLAANSEYFVTVNMDGTLSGDDKIPNVHGGTVIITKTDIVTGEPVADCEVTIYRVISEGKREEVFKQKTDKYGRIYFYTSTPGNYIFKETATCYGYYLNEDEFSFTISSDLKVSGTVRFSNVPFGTAVIKKVDKSGKPLQGAEISVYSESGKFLGKGVSAANGRIYFVSPGPGKYYYIENKAPKGYVKSESKYAFEIAKDYTITGALTIVNDRTPSNGSKTGDSSNIGILIGVASTCLVGAGAAFFVVVKKRKKEEAGK